MTFNPADEADIALVFDRLSPEAASVFTDQEFANLVRATINAAEDEVDADYLAQVIEVCGTARYHAKLLEVALAAPDEFAPGLEDGELVWSKFIPGGSEPPNGATKYS